VGAVTDATVTPNDATVEAETVSAGAVTSPITTLVGAAEARVSPGTWTSPSPTRARSSTEETWTSAEGAWSSVEVGGGAVAEVEPPVLS
jgi:hypothetical protein